MSSAFARTGNGQVQRDPKPVENPAAGEIGKLICNDSLTFGSESARLITSCGVPRWRGTCAKEAWGHGG